jgi:hypothetical protein
MRLMLSFSLCDQVDNVPNKVIDSKNKGYNEMVIIRMQVNIVNTFDSIGGWA